MEIAKVAEQMAVTAQTAPKTVTEVTVQKATSTLASDNADKYVKSDETFTPAYTKKSSQKNNVEVTEKFANTQQSTKAQHLESVVENLISHQARAQSPKKPQIIFMGESAITMDSLMNEEKDLEFWNAEATSNRIFDFAKTLSDDNDELLYSLKEAFMTGFQHAERSFGEKKLPSVCYDTYDRVNAMFEKVKEKLDAENGEEENI